MVQVRRWVDIRLSYDSLRYLGVGVTLKCYHLSIIGPGVLIPPRLKCYLFLNKKKHLLLLRARRGVGRSNLTPVDEVRKRAAAIHSCDKRQETHRSVGERSGCFCFVLLHNKKYLSDIFSLPCRRNPAQGHVASSRPPSFLRFVPSHVRREKTSVVSSLVGTRQIAAVYPRYALSPVNWFVLLFS